MVLHITKRYPLKKIYLCFKYLDYVSVQEEDKTKQYYFKIHNGELVRREWGAGDISKH